MSSKSEKDRTKQIQDRCQNILNQLLKDEDNKYCVDCDAKGPRWASWNLGIFLCIRCAGIHRNLGVHISKVKSVNLDSWTPEQVVSLQQMGNSRARAVYEANLPDSFRRPQTDTAIESFVRAKYEQKKYIAREWVPPALPKVNWDKEIDEEMEKQKRKKKSSTGSSNLSSLPTASVEKKLPKPSDVVPQPLPKPKSSVSPKPGRSLAKVSLNEPKSRDGVDLLGLTDGMVVEQKRSGTDDIFSGFLSGPEGKLPTAPDDFNTILEKPADLKQEEQSFFNQPAPTEKEKSKMTKDSILALYNQAPGQQQPFNGMPNQGSFPQYAQTYQMNQNGAMPVAQPPMNHFAQPQNYKFAPQSQYPPQNFQAFSQFPNGNGTQANYAATSQLTQQFGGMTVAQGAPANFASFPNGPNSGSWK